MIPGGGHYGTTSPARWGRAVFGVLRELDRGLGQFAHIGFGVRRGILDIAVEPDFDLAIAGLVSQGAGEPVDRKPEAGVFGD